MSTTVPPVVTEENGALPSPGTVLGEKTSEERSAILARQIAMLVAQKRRVESQSDYQAILARRRLGRDKREMVTVDEWGTPSIQPL